MRPSRHQTFMDVAHVFAKRSTCARLNVGAVIVAQKRIISVGYNGPEAGAPHCALNACPGARGCTDSLHAERNAIDFAFGADACPWQHATMYTTHSPCPDCARRIVAAGLERVFYQLEFRLPEGIEFLIGHKVDVYQLQPAGYVRECTTGKLFMANDLD